MSVSGAELQDTHGARVVAAQVIESPCAWFGFLARWPDSAPECCSSLRAMPIPSSSTLWLATENAGTISDLFRCVAMRWSEKRQ